MFQQKTNNIAEASHRKLQTQLSMSNLKIWKFIIEFRKVQAERKIYYKFLVVGNQPPLSKRKLIIDAANHILHLVQNYRNCQATEYLRGLAHNFIMDQLNNKINS